MKGNSHNHKLKNSDLARTFILFIVQTISRWCVNAIILSVMLLGVLGFILCTQTHIRVLSFAKC